MKKISEKSPALDANAGCSLQDFPSTLAPIAMCIITSLSLVFFTQTSYMHMYIYMYVYIDTYKRIYIIYSTWNLCVRKNTKSDKNELEKDGANIVRLLVFFNKI